MFRQSWKPVPPHSSCPCLGKDWCLFCLQVTKPISAPCLWMKGWIWSVDRLELKPNLQKTEVRVGAKQVTPIPKLSVVKVLY